MRETADLEAPEASAGTAPGGLALALIADGRLVWIMRELAAGGLQINRLNGRTGTIGASTLKSKLRMLGEVDVVRREPRGARSAGVVQHLEPAGHALLDLADRVFAWELRSNPDALGDMLSRGSPTLCALARPSMVPVLVRLAGRPRSLVDLERALRPLSRAQIQRRLERLLRARLARRRGELFELAPAGREAAGFLGRGARLEHDHGLSGAASATPADVAALLAVGVPLVRRAAAPVGWSCDLVVEGSRDAEEQPAICRVAVDAGGAPAAGPRPVDAGYADATVLGASADWCAALFEGRRGRLRFRRGGRAPRALLADLERAFSLDR